MFHRIKSSRLRNYEGDRINYKMMTEISFLDELFTFLYVHFTMLLSLMGYFYDTFMVFWIFFN